MTHKNPHEVEMRVKRLTEPLFFASVLSLIPPSFISCFGVKGTAGLEIGCFPD